MFQVAKARRVKDCVVLRLAERRFGDRQSLVERPKEASLFSKHLRKAEVLVLGSKMAGLWQDGRHGFSTWNCL